tara:strand:+ start:295 stop:474 length:180 start_codon:yes stop_codon:yes gene_type:complete
MKKTLLQKTMEDVLSKLIEKDKKESNLICIAIDRNGNKTYTTKNDRRWKLGTIKRIKNI